MSWMQHFPSWFGWLQTWLEFSFSIYLVSPDLPGEFWADSKIKCVCEIWQTELGHIHDFLHQKLWAKPVDFLNFHSALDSQYLGLLGNVYLEKSSPKGKKLRWEIAGFGTEQFLPQQLKEQALLQDIMLTQEHCMPLIVQLHAHCPFSAECFKQRVVLQWGITC